jgi:AraC-like DNA-binding protein
MDRHGILQRFRKIVKMRQHSSVPDPLAYTEVMPPPQLADYVEACWFYQPRLVEPSPDILIPEGVIDLIFNFGAPYYRASANNGQKTGAWVSGDVVAGQRNCLFSIEWPQETRVVGIRLKPEAAYLFLPLSLHQITNLTIPLEDTGFLELSRAIHRFSYQDQTSIAAECFNFLADQLSRLEDPDVRVSAVIHEIEAQEGDIDIQRLLDKLGFNRRTVERLFAEKVGVSPKFLARTIRLHHFLYLQREHAEDKLTDAALNAQYYDQSHLIKEFKQFTGETPARFFNSPPDIYEPLLTSLLARRQSAKGN